MANINEDYATRRAREARERFAVIKASAQTDVENARVEAYEAYVESVKQKNEEWGFDYNPHPYENFQWKTCVVCKKMITDDPFGHNAAPLKKGKCCGMCNARVCDARIRLM